ncbi:hypothetical protein cyc_04865 [Cyclospora cayetanensis]|uniref:Uncharacterized protein n=1 Tax=Cyclospora cayetanensis TaxID=88456 RepID=A0A1D3CZU6_9EIME|nr:hypothetical protein cyc_04865 [Cyclospora cayetanensis]
MPALHPVYQHEKEIQKKHDEVRMLREKYSQSLENLKLQEETQRGLDASLRNEAAAYHCLKSDLNTLVSTHKHSTCARNRTTFEKRVRLCTLLSENKFIGSTDVSSSTDAGKELPLILTFQDVVKLVAQHVLSYDAISQFAKAKMAHLNDDNLESSPVDFLLSLVDFTMYAWNPRMEQEINDTDIPFIRGVALKETLLASRKWYCAPKATFFGSSSLQGVGEEVPGKRKNA